MASGELVPDAPALRRILIIALPDCMVVKSWSRAGEIDADEAGARLGALLRDAHRALAAFAEADDPELLLSLESELGSVVALPVADDLAAALLFEAGAPMGLVRVQARRVAEHIRATVRAAERR